MAMEMRERIASLSNCFIQKSLSFSMKDTTEDLRDSLATRENFLPSSSFEEDFIEDLRCNLMKTIYLVMAGHDNVPMNGIYVQMPILSCQFYLYPRHFLPRHPPPPSPSPSMSMEKNDYIVYQAKKWTRGVSIYHSYPATILTKL